MSDTPDDEIEASRAPLLDHLVDLRSRLIRCVIALILGFLLCFAFSTLIFTLLLHPFSVAAGLLAVRQHDGRWEIVVARWPAPSLTSEHTLGVGIGSRPA